MNLSKLRVGENAVIKDIHAEEGIRQRLRAMGLRSGREARLIRCAQLGGPLQIRVGSVTLIIRRSDAERISVSPVPSHA